MAEPSHFECWSQGLATVVRPRARDLFWLRGFEDYWPDDRSRQFSDELMALADAAPGTLVLDLSRVPGLNRDGLALLVTLRSRLAGRGGELALCVSPGLLELFELCGLDRLFSCSTRPETAEDGA